MALHSVCGIPIPSFLFIICFITVLIIFSVYNYVLIFLWPNSYWLEDTFYFGKPFKPLSSSMMLHIDGHIKNIANIKQIYIINLPNRSDRRRNSIALMQTFDLDALIIPAYTIHSPEVVARTWLVRHGRITLVELACWASHMQVWSNIIASNNSNSWSLIFEDDIDLEMVTLEVLNSFPSDLWNKTDLIYLGYCGNQPGSMIYEGAYGYRIHRALYPSCTHAYAIQSSSASKLLRLLSSPHKAIDDEIVDLTNNEKIQVFSIHPPLAIQKSITSSNPSDVNPLKDTLWFHFIRWINSILEYLRGAEFVDKLKDSAFARSNLSRAEEWRKDNEKEFG